MARTGYFHGDLRRALIDAGLDAARAGGSAAISIRELARAVGVAPSAVYRHFDDQQALLTQVALRAQRLVAIEMAERRRELVDPLPAEDARARALAALHAVGRGYVRFAWNEPGWFELAFHAHRDLEAAHSPDAADDEGRTPFAHLQRAVDELIAAGLVHTEAKVAAEAFAWSSVHGFATLTTSGPLRMLDADARESLGQQLIGMAVSGVVADQRGSST